MMSAVLISTKGQIVLPAKLRQSLGLKPGMRVDVRLEGKGAVITPAPAKHTSQLSDIQEILKYSGPKLSIEEMQVTQYKD
jgi:AbrB family looped-hinge helix DNA binding protein